MADKEVARRRRERPWRTWEEHIADALKQRGILWREATTISSDRNLWKRTIKYT